ncbi:MAG: DUF3791 domain-containing protein [Epulopiscium sp.]|jgi:hypothetical protein|nr:DUF3791 domain-containing protein [Candidatus Epulonipiscium sp.]
MNKLEMLIACIEHYSYLKDVPGNQVFVSFAQKGVLTMLLDSYDVFRDMDIGFFMGVIDGYVENTIDAEEKHYIHYEERKKKLPQVVASIMKQYNMDEIKALEQFYLSDTGALFSQDTSELYKKTPEELFALYVQEQEK